MSYCTCTFLLIQAEHRHSYSCDSYHLLLHAYSMMIDMYQKQQQHVIIIKSNFILQQHGVAHHSVIGY